MTFDVHPAGDNEEYGDALQAIGQYFGMQLNDEAIERFLKVLPLERMHAARENGTIVGGAGAFSWDMSIPGGTLRRPASRSSGCIRHTGGAASCAR